MTFIYRCPKCDARFDPPRAEESDCFRYGIWFHKWNAVPVAHQALSSPEIMPDSLSYYGRAIALVFAAIRGVRLAAMDYHVGEMGGSFMHHSLLPIHEAGHVFMMPCGVLRGGSWLGCWRSVIQPGSGK